MSQATQAQMVSQSAICAMLFTSISKENAPKPKINPAVREFSAQESLNPLLSAAFDCRFN
jgi:hypothetical protein